MQVESAQVTQSVNGASWRYSGFALMALLLLVLYVCRDTVASVIGMWNQLQDGEFAHGYLVLAISLYMVFAMRRKLASTTPCEYAPGLLVIALSGVLWLAASLADVQMVQAFATLVMMMAVIWTIAGSHVARQLVLPVAFLMFAIPVWSPLSPLLQELTADVVYWMVRVVGIPALRQDYQIILPSGTLSIEEACSGLRYLLAALTLAVFYGWLNYEKTRARILVVAIAALAAIAGNIIRVFIIIYLAYVTEMEHPWVSDHLAFGWWLFGGAILLLLIIDVVLHQRVSSATAPGVQASAPSLVSACPHRRGYRFGILLLAAIMVMTGPALATLLEQRSAREQLVVQAFPAGADGWSGPFATSDDWLPRYHDAVPEKQAYRKDNATVLLYTGSYAIQQQGSELISEMNTIASAPEWQLRNSNVQPRSVAGLTVLERRLVSEQGQDRLVWYWYRVAGVATSNRYLAKLLQLYGLLVNRTDASLVAVATDVYADTNEAQKQLRDFIRANRPML